MVNATLEAGESLMIAVRDELHQVPAGHTI